MQSSFPLFEHEQKNMAPYTRAAGLKRARPSSSFMILETAHLFLGPNGFPYRKKKKAYKPDTGWSGSSKASSGDTLNIVFTFSLKNPNTHTRSLFFLFTSVAKHSCHEVTLSCLRVCPSR